MSFQREGAGIRDVPQRQGRGRGGQKLKASDGRAVWKTEKYRAFGTIWLPNSTGKWGTGKNAIKYRVQKIKRLLKIIPGDKKTRTRIKSRVSLRCFTYFYEKNRNWSSWRVTGQEDKGTLFLTHHCRWSQQNAGLGFIPPAFHLNFSFN